MSFQVGDHVRFHNTQNTVEKIKYKTGVVMALDSDGAHVYVKFPGVMSGFRTDGTYRSFINEFYLADESCIFASVDVDLS